MNRWKPTFQSEITVLDISAAEILFSAAAQRSIRVEAARYILRHSAGSSDSDGIRPVRIAAGLSGSENKHAHWARVREIERKEYRYAGKRLAKDGWDKSNLDDDKRSIS